MANDLHHGLDCRIYVPAKFAEQVRASFAKLKGGYTEYPSNGSWVAPDGRVVDESIVVFSILTSASEPVEDLFAAVAFLLRTHGEQKVLTQYVPCSFRLQ